MASAGEIAPLSVAERTPSATLRNFRASAGVSSLSMAHWFTPVAGGGRGRHQKRFERTDHTPPLHRALNDAVSEGCEIANVSLGCPCGPGPENGRAVDRAYLRGLIMVAAAGNVTSEVTYPRKHLRTIAAGGVTKIEGKWKPSSGNSRGSRVDFCAPADRITRADWIRDDNGVWSDEFEEDKGDGTSYAAAFISGIACLWIARWVNELSRYKGWQLVEAFRTVLGETCHVPDGWDHKRFGYGIVDAHAALKAPLPDDIAANDLF